ncbi:MAG TPA: HEAT repeat domain-containing protein [Blastocatellia bacterium]|nr:HEAT repeat domain-containing protein [Blastocatellia bacterium]
MLHRNHIFPLFLMGTALVFILSVSGFAQFASSDLNKLNRFVQSTNASDKAARAFRTGRDLIEDEKWEQAEKHFRNFLRDYPQHNQADAAIYWLAYTQKKQRHFSEADQLLVQLVTAYPKSSWVSDAKALRLEIAPMLGNVAYVVQEINETPPPPRPRATAPAAVTVAQGQAPTPPPPQPARAVAAPAPGETVPALPPGAPVAIVGVGEGFGGFTTVAVPGQASARSPMSEQDEIKAIALQSLMQSNPERALPYIAEILKNDSKASKGLKESAVRLLGQYRGPSATNLLLDLARNQADPRLRRSAIYSLSSVDDDKVFDLLLDLATKSEDPEIAKAALRALASHRNQKAKDSIGNLALSAKSPLIRRDAIYFLGERKDDTAIDRLISIYDNDPDPEIKKHAIYALSRSGNPKARAKVMEVARASSNEESRVQALQWLDDRADESFIDELVKMFQTDKSAKVRKQIVYSLSQIASDGVHYYAPVVAAGQSGAPGFTTNLSEWRTADSATRTKSREKAMKALLQLYDSESDEAMKSQFLFAFSQSRSKDAVQKLIQIAKSDSSMTLRRKAVTYLGQSRDPEAVKFLEDILK